VNLLNCPACRERHLLQHGQHYLPNGESIECAGHDKQIGPLIIVDPLLPAGVVWLIDSDGRRYKCLDLFFEGVNTW
jgi:hypothetical protein